MSLTLSLSVSISHRIQFKVLIFVFKAQLCFSSKVSMSSHPSPLSTTSRVSDRLNLFAPRLRTTQLRSFASIYLSLWNRLPQQFAPPYTLLYIGYPHLSLTSDLVWEHF